MDVKFIVVCFNSEDPIWNNSSEMSQIKWMLMFH